MVAEVRKPRLGVAIIAAVLMASSAVASKALAPTQRMAERYVGVSLERTRLLVLLTAAVLTAMAVSAVGVVGFVGLVAPHIARALVGVRSARVVPVAVLVGALLLVVADSVGRTVISPAQVPAGLVVALIGAPYFVVLLARSRA